MSAGGGDAPSELSPARLQFFALQASAELGKAVAQALGCELEKHEERHFEDGEHKTRPVDTVAGRDVFIVQRAMASVRSLTRTRAKRKSASRA